MELHVIEREVVVTCEPTGSFLRQMDMSMTRLHQR